MNVPKNYPPTICFSSFKMASYHSYKNTSYYTTDGSRGDNFTTPERPHAKPSYSSSSDDEVITSLKGLALQSRTKEIISTSNSPGSTNSSPRHGTLGAHVDTISTFNTPKKSNSIPITIEQSITRKRVYTPLTGRGELPGGYFPGFADENPETLKSAVLLSTSRSRASPEVKSLTMSSVLSPMDSPSSDATVRSPPSIISSPFTLPETLVMPKGKYYPSNYKPAPTSPAPSVASPILNGGNLQLPPKSQRQKSTNPNHQRRSSDIKRKLQKYQRDMIEQARMVHASVTSSPGVPCAPGSKPVSPRLLPLGSPGPITPFELEESSGYLIAGQTRSGGLAEGRLRENEAVARMIRVEEERRRREGQSSPVARV
ncbi:0f8a16ac-842e-4d9a-9bd3-25512091f7a1 [Sclerotinia trifoliorum]|uniref:0f8a16ac-842e-4d9a-9bd3-25512091f7a1 n=1 Tax=Sclerotinia trifoliorum TaxID=28548 RepID=A0A8H2VSS2_9HELO|nr:0f8a16ac-842e-4d9a-9bd3-25512091f7a1 [Sclerotinia trifoliorum]